MGAIGRAVLCVCVTGCGRLGYDELAPQPGVDGNLIERPFTTGPLDEAATADLNEDDPSLTDDGLELYFNGSDGGGAADIFLMTRASIDDAWTAPAVVTELSGPSYESTPCVSGDGRTIWFASNRSPSVSTDIWVSTRPDRSSSWGTPELVAELSSPREEALGLRATGLAITLVSDRDVAGDFDLYISTRTSTSQPWGPAERIAALSTTALDESPHLSADGLHIYFASEVSGNLDIYTASRPSAGERFGPPVPVDGVNTAGLDSDPWVSTDGDHILFVREVAGSWDIYEGWR